MKIYELEVNNGTYGVRYRRFKRPVEIKAESFEEAVEEFKRLFPKWKNSLDYKKHPYSRSELSSCIVLNGTRLANLGDAVNEAL